MTTSSSYLRSKAPAADQQQARGVRALAAMAVLGALMLGTPMTALHAAGGTVPVQDIQIVGTPKLFIERPGTGAGYHAAWVVFQTRPHLHVVRQVVVEVRGARGRSYTASGAPNCVRSTILNATSLVKPGGRYRVRFYAGKSRTAHADTLITTRSLVARTFKAPSKHYSTPHCGS
jgi:FtsP/CotA-like multicopper oxidase with cupredoxin domain